MERPDHIIAQAVWIAGIVSVVGEIPSARIQFVDSSAYRSQPEHALSVLENRQDNVAAQTVRVAGDVFVVGESLLLWIRPFGFPQSLP